MRRLLALFVLAMAALALPGSGAWPASDSEAMRSGTAPVSDAIFAQKAAVSDMFEISAGKVAQLRAVSADVKSFASKMVDAHTKTANQLKSILSSKPGIRVPAIMDAPHRIMINDLRRASGSDFDRLYAQQQIRTHNAAVMLFTGYSQNGKDSDLRKFATGTLPVIQQHLAMAQTLEKGGGTP